MKKITQLLCVRVFSLIYLLSIQAIYASSSSEKTNFNEESLACTGTVVNTYPYSESFEGSIGGWMQGPGTWTPGINTTASPDTGPFKASDGNEYLYTESSVGEDPGVNGTAILTSPCIDLSTESQAFFSYDYHMFGANMGDLQVQVSTDMGTTWTTESNFNGQAQNDETKPWRKDIIDLSPYIGSTLNIRFVGNTGAGFRSDMAIDNILITNTPQYCGSAATYNNGGVTNVSFNTIDNATPAESNAYSDFTSQSTDVVSGSSYNLSVRVNTDGPYNTGTRVWIDWNQDFDFLDAGEQYTLGTANSVANGLTSASPLPITIPATAALGTTRMRVSTRYNQYPTSCQTGYDGEVEDYSVNIIAAAPLPEITITGLSNEIADGDNTPNIGDNTDFGTIIAGNTNPNTFIIENLGTDILNLTGASPYITITGPDAPLFTVTATPSNSIAAGATTSFEITFSPVLGGTFNATLSIANNDTNENPYNFSLRGAATGPAPEIALTGAGNSILSGDVTPTSADGTDFGVSPVGANTTQNFIISNSGTATLMLTGASPFVEITGSPYFSVTAIPNNTIAPSGGSTNFTINYNPLATGTHTATISIANNDSDENPYTFTVRGVATNTPRPEMDVVGNGVSIPDNDTTPDTADDTNFGTATVGATRVKAFDINNIGTATLNLTGPSPHITISGANAGQFYVATVPASTIGISETTTFQIGYNPTAAGTHNAIITIANNDSDENPYNFNVRGNSIVDIAPKYTIYYENFDASNGGWNATNPGGNTVWTYGTNGVEPGTEGNYWYTSNYNNYSNNSNTYATSPTLNMVGYNNLFIHLDIRYDTDADPLDGMNIEYSTNNGITWNLLGAYAATPVGQWYNTDDVSALGSGVDGWSGRNGGGAGSGRSDFRRASIALPPSLNDNPLARIRVRFASNGSTTANGVNFDNVFIKGDPITPFANPADGPANITDNLKLWLKANSNTSTTIDGTALDNWSDSAFDNDAVGISTNRPTYRNNSLDNINHNPVIDFNTAADTELKSKGGFYTEEYWVVLQSEGNIDGSSPLQGVVAGRKATQELAEDGTGLWINPGSLRFQFDNNLISHMVGTTPGNLSGINDGSYGRAYASPTDSYDNEVIILNIKTNSAGDQTEIYKNGIRIDNITGGTSSSPYSTLPYSEADNSSFILGVGRISVYGTPYDSHLDGKITEFISYAAPNSVFDQRKIQSYLALKNGVTLHDISSTTVTREGDENYIDTNGDVYWNVATNSGFNYDIAGIGTDIDAGLEQKQSTSVNPGTIVTIGLTDILDTNSQNIAINSNTIANRNFLVWGNNNESFNAASAITVDMSAGIPGLSTIVDFTSIQRTWKIVETGSVGEVKVSVPEISLSATITPPGSFFMFISDTPTFSPTSEYRILNLNGSNLEANYDFDGVKYITFGYAPEYIYERSITFDGIRDYLDAGDNLDLDNTFTVSAWVNHTNSNYTVLSKRDAAYTEGYDLRILNDRRVRMRWRNSSGTNQRITSNTSIPNGEWHQIAISYDGTTARLYIDGFLDNTANLSAPVSTDNHFIIAAADEKTPTAFYEGTIDEVRVWNTNLTIDQLRFVMNQEIEEHSDTSVRGKIIPTGISKSDISAIPWSNLDGYFPMNLICVYKY